MPHVPWPASTLDVARCSVAADFSQMLPDASLDLAAGASAAPGVINPDVFGVRFTFYMQVTYRGFAAPLWCCMCMHVSGLLRLHHCFGCTSTAATVLAAAAAPSQ